ncbi:MAG: hypothetical protein P4M15_12490 [Alphaproteobacteria bacterium]|nr:hypothetical protein [Alphaproteobacteria bacterium]
MMAKNTDVVRLSPSAGIAIGPILFIIAILAILAAAIAAGSGSFTAGTTTESNRTKSSALIQIGENLKIGMDRITLEGGLAPTSVDTNGLNTSAANALFSPIGGGIAAPSVSMANDPTTDKWYYVQGPVNGLGTGANNTIAVLKVTGGVCSEINNRVTGTALLPTGAALGDFTTNVSSGGGTSWPVNLVGSNVGCVNNTTNAAAGYWFYQVLAVQ